MAKINRNDACPCGSGKKYKKCCQLRDETQSIKTQLASNTIAQLFKTALAHHQAEQLQQAEAIYQQILQIDTNHPDALHLSGVIAHQIGKTETAVELINKAIKLNPSIPSYYNNLALALKAQGNLDEAIVACQQGLLINPDDLCIYNNLGNVFKDQGKLDQAIASYRQALALNPKVANTYNNLGVVFKEQGKLNEAIKYYRQALALNPNYAKAHSNLGVILKEQNKLTEAIACYRQALALNPNYAEAYNNLGGAFQQQNKLDAAINSYHQALVLNPNFSEVYRNLAAAFKKQGKLIEAISNYRQALFFNPNDALAHDGLFNLQLQCCDWIEYSQNIEKIICAVSQGGKGYAPFSFLNISDSASLQLQCAHSYAQHKHPLTETLVWTGELYQHNKIRIAYISADFREHPLSYLMVGLFESHDKQQFEIIALSLKPAHQSEIGQRVKAAFSQFIDVSNKSAEEIALLIKALEIDIAVDLMGFTIHSKTDIFAYRPAPIQVNYLGYPGTMGAAYIDYIIADQHIIPKDQQTYYAEQVVYLPDSYFVNDDKRVIADYTPTRSEVNLPKSGFVFCCFNKNYKISPHIFDIWMRLLSKVEGSVLWLFESNSFACDNLQQEAIKRGIDPQRLVFASRMNQKEHLARHRLADLFLDTQIYNAHTTASDALWAGLPVLTCMGKSFASRVAGSLLYALDLPELITHNLADYEALALKLATTPTLLAEIRGKLAHNRNTCPLFDTDRFRRHLESAYITMWEKYQRKEQPTGFIVSAISDKNQEKKAISETIAQLYATALAHHQAKQLPQAEAIYYQILQLDSNYANALHLLGVITHQMTKSESAIEFIAKAITLSPSTPVYYSNLGRVLKEQGKPNEAIKNYQQALLMNPDYVEFYNELGNLFKEQGKLNDAIRYYQQALVVNPNYAVAYYNLGIALKEQGRLNEAIVSYQQGLLINPTHIEAHSNLGGVFQAQGKLNEAINCYRHALSLNPNYAEIHNKLAGALQQQGNLNEAIGYYRQALTFNPNYAEAHGNLGATFQKQGKLNEAISCYRQALALNSDYIEIHSNLGEAFRQQNKLNEAINCYRQALKLNPNDVEAYNGLFNSQLQGCDWTEYNQNVEKVIHAVSQGDKANQPFPFLNISDAPFLQLKCAQVYAENYHPLAKTLLWTDEIYQHSKIRIAYLSADFHAHATAYLMAELFEKHDKNRFEIIAISFGIDDKSDMRDRLKHSFNQFIDVCDKNDYEVALLLRELEIDIAVDLKGYTKNCRPGILAHRPAPVQVNYLGYPGSMGAEYIDYIIADKRIIPEEQQVYYTEQVAYLPDSYQVNDSNRQIDAYTPTRAEVNLPETGFIFCCFNNNYKITPFVFDIWMRLLSNVEGSVLWLFEGNSFAAHHLQQEAIKRGVDPQRLIFAPRMNLDKHLARHRLADLFLDTLPYNAHTTSSDALWAGLPVLTCMGESFASRVAGSLLYAIDLPELITHNLADYEALALKLATTPTLLAQIRTKLAHNRNTCPLFDTDRFRRNIELAYLIMWEKYQRGELPSSFSIN